MGTVASNEATDHNTQIHLYGFIRSNGNTVNKQHMINTMHLYFRTIYHDNEHEHFAKKLESRIKLQDKEIEKMCHRHYQGFIDAVRELLQVRGQANSVKVIS